MTSQRNLNLGLILTSHEVPAWFSHSLERVRALDGTRIRLVLMVMDEHEDGERTARGSSSGESFFYQTLNRIDRKRFVRSPDALEIVDLSEMLTGIPILPVRSVREGERQRLYMDQETAEVVRAFDLDLIVAYEFQQFDEAVLSAANGGVWYYEFSGRSMRGGPPGFWEVIEKQSESISALCSRGRGFENGWTICRRNILTYPFSPARNCNTLLWASASLLPRQIARLQCLGEAKFIEGTAHFNWESQTCPVSPVRIPSNIEVLWSYGRLFFRQVGEFVQRKRSLDTWYLMFSLDQKAPFSFKTFQKITPPKDRFWADPHIIHKDGRYFIFVEEYSYQRERGEISVIEMDAQGRFGKSVPVISENYHLSYPFVFEHEGRYYMVPESAENNTIDLYECVEFPAGWKFKMHLMRDVKAVDTTLFQYQGKWWLFTGMAEHAGAFPEVELFLFSSDDLFSTDWKPHPLNPVVSDISSARPAGRLFVKDGKIYRPSQNCSKSYGYGFNINEIECLTPTEYSEKKVMAVEPDWDAQLKGTHTCTQVDDLTMIDGYTRRRRFG